LHHTIIVRLVDVLVACGRMEERAAALYRRFAGEVPADSPYASLWNEMAREEDGHAAAVREA
jgi:rubrerythrin